MVIVVATWRVVTRYPFPSQLGWHQLGGLRGRLKSYHHPAPTRKEPPSIIPPHVNESWVVIMSKGPLIYPLAWCQSFARTGDLFKEYPEFHNIIVKNTKFNLKKSLIISRTRKISTWMRKDNNIEMTQMRNYLTSRLSVTTKIIQWAIRNVFETYKKIESHSKEIEDIKKKQKENVIKLKLKTHWMNPTTGWRRQSKWSINLKIKQ